MQAGVELAAPLPDLANLPFGSASYIPECPLHSQMRHSQKGVNSSVTPNFGVVTNSVLGMHLALPNGS